MSGWCAYCLEYWRSGGVLLLFLAALSVALWCGLISLRSWLRASLKRPEALLERGDMAEGAIERVRAALLVMAALTGAAPLLGLLGTVIGMVDTFHAVGSAGGETAGRVAEGISKALITTQFGLVIAIPGVFGVSRLRRLLYNLEARLAAIRAMRRLGAS